ncbi:hypothetical protein Tco_0043519 [Tanacetum coccineum]
MYRFRGRCVGVMRDPLDYNNISLPVVWMPTNKTSDSLKVGGSLPKASIRQAPCGHNWILGILEKDQRQHNVQCMVVPDTNDDANISRLEGDFPTWVDDDSVDQENEVEWQHYSYEK